MQVHLDIQGQCSDFQSRITALDFESKELKSQIASSTAALAEAKVRGQIFWGRVYGSEGESRHDST